MVTETREKRASVITLPNTKRPLIGVLQRDLASKVKQMRWLSTVDAARQANASVISFMGGRINVTEGFENQANIVYALVDPQRFDGLNIWPAGIGGNLTREETESFVRGFQPTPLVSCDQSISGIPSVVMEAYAGMHEAVQHLIQAHSYRRIAFLRGPANHPSAKERFRAYTETMTECGLPQDPRLISPPVGWHDPGAPAMRVLFEERGLRPGVDIEAIVAANFAQAFDAMLYLQARGVLVPNDVAIVGYDDPEEALTTTPPITTVRPPINEVGQNVIESLLGQMRGERVPEQITPLTRLVIRQSCGCINPLVLQAAAGQVDARNESLAVLLTNEHDEIVTAIEQALGMRDRRASAERLVDGLAADTAGQTPGAFISALDEILRQEIAANGDVTTWQSAVSVLRRRTLPCLNGEVLLHAEDLWGQARVAIAEAATRVQARRLLQVEAHAQVLQEIVQTMLATFDVGDLMNVLAKNLPKLGIPSCYLSLYENPAPYNYPQPPPEWSRLVMAFNEKGRISLEPDGLRFPSRHLAPEGMLPLDRQYSFVAESLYFQNDQIGFVLLEQGPREGMIYETLRGQISSALQGAYLVQERQRAQQAIEEGAVSVTSASEQILNTSTQMAAVTKEQASAVNEITTTVQEIKITAEQVAERAQGVAAGAEMAAQVAHKGIEAVKAAMAGMTDIEAKVKAIAENIGALAKQTQQAENIVDTVADIAGQSNILALNAAIEAAHAGELGERFRVVADEVKHLAGQSRQAAKQVKTILANIQKAADNAVAATDEGTSGVSSGNELVSKAADTITKLAQAVEESAQAADQIVAGVHQQTIGLDQISIGMNDINQAAQQSAEAALQSQKAATGLNELAERLKGIVSQSQAAKRATS